MSKQRNLATVWIGRNSVPAVLLSNVEGAATSPLWPQLHVLSHMPVPIQLLGLIDGVDRDAIDIALDAPGAGCSAEFLTLKICYNIFKI
ncbi:hypothetical protein T10_9641 [Trichinella papuae]|uniref:Uncharacterized protein n=1 Tax=Trichinella papuae TaxID=268474 RepID=A0A0V1N370_9BILA|nr:hypothetical protein T10_9641 [Trichinella papuae]